jgi:hypothetical protein
VLSAHLLQVSGFSDKVSAVRIMLTQRGGSSIEQCGACCGHEDL